MSKPRLAYIASPSYSGSTLLTLLLARHPAIATVGELKWGDIDLQTYQCSCGELLRSCSFWAELQARLRRCGFHFPLNRPATEFRVRKSAAKDRILRARLGGKFVESARALAIASIPSLSNLRARVVALNYAAIHEILEMQRGSVFVDSSKDPIRFMHLARGMRYDMHLIHLVRDGRAVVCSAAKNAGVNLCESSLDWLRTNAEIERLKAELPPDRVSFLRYEDLCRDTDATMDQLFFQLGVNSIPRDSGNRVHHIHGNRMRLQNLADIRLDERWRTQLTSANSQQFDAIAGHRNRNYGYGSDIH